MTNSERLRILADWLDDQTVKYEMRDIKELLDIPILLRKIADQIEE